MQDVIVLGGVYSGHRVEIIYYARRRHTRRRLHGNRVEIIYYARRRRTRRRLQRSSSRDNLLCKTSSY